MEPGDAVLIYYDINHAKYQIDRIKNIIRDSSRSMGIAHDAVKIIDSPCKRRGYRHYHKNNKRYAINDEKRRPDHIQLVSDRKYIDKQQQCIKCQRQEIDHVGRMKYLYGYHPPVFIGDTGHDIHSSSQTP